MQPARLTRPYVGRSPVRPQRVLGDTMLPHVSVPIANGTRPAAVAAPGPAEEPLEPCSRFHGFFVVPPNQTSPHASAPTLSFATSTAPAPSSFPDDRRGLVALLLRVGPRAPRRGVARHGQQILRPPRDPVQRVRRLPAARSRSARAAASRARSSVSVTTHSSFGSKRRSRSSERSVSSTAETSRAPEPRREVGDRGEREIVVRGGTLGPRGRQLPGTGRRERADRRPGSDRSGGRGPPRCRARRPAPSRDSRGVPSRPRASARARRPSTRARRATPPPGSARG